MDAGPCLTLIGLAVSAGGAVVLSLYPPAPLIDTNEGRGALIVEDGNVDDATGLTFGELRARADAGKPLLRRRSTQGFWLLAAGFVIQALGVWIAA